jgi:hypothetical protein
MKGREFLNLVHKMHILCLQKSIGKHLYRKGRIRCCRCLEWAKEKESNIFNVFINERETITFTVIAIMLCINATYGLLAGVDKH